MKTITLFLITMLLVGCSTGRDDYGYRLRTVEYLLDDGRTKVDVPYYLMPEGIAIQLLSDATEQKDKYPEYWQDAFKGDSTSLWHNCSTSGCNHAIHIYYPCATSRAIRFKASGEYPNLHFDYIGHEVTVEESCYVRSSLWSRLFGRWGN